MNERMSYIRFKTYDPYEIGHAESYHVHPALNYAGDESSLHTLYLSVPKNIEKPPLIVFIPGGGLTSCGRTAPESLWNKWCAVAELRYRLYPAVKNPGQIEDVLQALVFLRKNAPQYGYDPERIVIAGQSAGGWIAAMTVFDPANLRKIDFPQEHITGMILLSAQLTTHFKVKEFSHPQIPRFVPLVDENAPLAHLRQDLPPLLLITGDPELEIPGRVDENRLCTSSLKALGHSNVRHYILQGYAHSPAIAGSSWLVDVWLNELFGRDHPV